MMNDSFCRIIAGENQARPEKVDAAVRLLDEGNTVPFIARYRKENTGGLDYTCLLNTY
ncbi:Tex-like N-terminal domain-containing protein, partial [Escherichia coli]|uniref:Tex-like N-terminal domain-containing protein n=1 Tax=Escherichia coli TaxID=562 RepID=UPI003016DB87